MNRLDARFIKEVGQFKNRIINGDFSVAQRGESFRLENEARYTIDRVLSNVYGYVLSVRRDKIYAPDEGSLVNTLDIFGDSSCIATYTFDGNANDLSGNYNGTWSGNEQYDIGRFGQAAKFDGSSYISTPLTGNDFPGDITISLWTKEIIDNGDLQSLIQNRRDLNEDRNCSLGLLLDFRSNGRCINAFGGDGSSCYSCRYSLDCINWATPHHIVAVRTNSEIKLYLDGVLVNSISSGPIFKADNKYYIGGNYGTSGFAGVNGLIDQIRIFNRALTDDEIKILYTESNHYKESPTYFLYYKIEDEDTSNSNRHIHSFVYRFEGQHLYDLAIQGKKVTLSFEFAANKNGDYSLSFRDCTHRVADSYIKRFTYNGGGEFQKFEFTFDLSEFPKRFENNENKGFELIIGSNDKSYEAPSEGLHTGVDYHFLTGTNQWQKGDWFRIRRVQLEEGDRATEFEYVPYEIQLMRCMRYYERRKFLFQGYAGESGNLYVTSCLKPTVPMRTIPSVSSIGYLETNNVETTLYVQSGTVAPTGENFFIRTKATGTGRAYWQGTVVLDAEL